MEYALLRGLVVADNYRLTGALIYGFNDFMSSLRQIKLLEAVLISFDKFVKHDLDECNLYHSFCGFSKEFIIDGQPSEVFQP